MLVRNQKFLLCLAGSLPICFGSALAQTTPAPLVPPDDGSYTLKANALKPVGDRTQPGSATPYELKSTSISGSSGSTDTILTIPVDPGAAPFKTESGIYFYPTVFVGYGHNSNLETTDINPTSSDFVNVAPQLIAELKHKGDRYTAMVGLNSTRYFDSSADNYNNSDINVAGDHYFSSRARAGWSVGQVNGTDARGSNNRPVMDEPDRWHTSDVNGRFIYGAPAAQGRIEFDLGNTVKTYDNNRVNTAVADLTRTTVAGRMFYRLGTRSLALIEVRNAKAAYSSALATDSNTERRYYGGLTWDATAATTGIVKLGHMTKDFDQAGKKSFAGTSWEASVRWLPRTYSAFDLQTSRYSADASGLGDYQLFTSTDLVWNHKWSQSLTSRVALGVLVTDFMGAGIDRTDTANNFAFTLDYQVMRWLKMGVDFSVTDSTSNVPNASFKRNISMFTLNASF